MRTATVSEAARSRGLARITDFREFMILMVIVAASIIMSIASPYFLTRMNILANLLSVSIECIVAVGMTVLMVSGGFDMSVGSTVALCGATGAMAMRAGIPVLPAILIALAVGTLVGLINGLLIAKVGINPFITTLGMMSVLRGILLVVTQARNITGLPQSFRIIGQGNFLGIQYPIIIALVFLIVGDILLRKSRFFRQNYYIGGNRQAARLSGINVDGITIFNYALTGFLAALAAWSATTRLGAASVTAGTGLELKVISAVIGSASLSGERGTVIGSFLGALLMAIITNALTLLGVDVYWNEFVIEPLCCWLWPLMLLAENGARRHSCKASA